MGREPVVDLTDQVQIADELGLSVKAVIRRLAHPRGRVANTIRPQQGRKPTNSKRPTRTNRVHPSNRKAAA